MITNPRAAFIVWEDAHAFKAQVVENGLDRLLSLQVVAVVPAQEFSCIAQGGNSALAKIPSFMFFVALFLKAVLRHRVALF